MTSQAERVEQALGRLEQALRVTGHALLDALQPGLHPAAVTTAMAPTGLRLPEGGRGPVAVAQRRGGLVHRRPDPGARHPDVAAPLIDWFRVDYNPPRP